MKEHERRFTTERCRGLDDTFNCNSRKYTFGFID